MSCRLPKSSCPSRGACQPGIVHHTGRRSTISWCRSRTSDRGRRCQCRLSCASTTHRYQLLVQGRGRLVCPGRASSPRRTGPHRTNHSPSHSDLDRGIGRTRRRLCIHHRCRTTPLPGLGVLTRSTRPHRRLRKWCPFYAPRPGECVQSQPSFPPRYCPSAIKSCLRLVG